jgi:putative ABC transport system permease protein
MFRNYFKIAYRNLTRHKFISFINLFGLTIGLTCCLLITCFILNELSFDRQSANAPNIYRLTRSFNNQDGVTSLNLSSVAPPFGYYMPGEFPDIKKMTRFLPSESMPMRYKDRTFNESVFFADENFVDVFQPKVLRGDSRKGLQEPFSVMITPEIAQKYFGTEDPIDKSIRYNSQLDFKVTGIYEAFPSNSYMHPGMLLSFNTLRDSAIYGEQQLRTNWSNNSFQTYFLLPDNYPVQSMVSKFPAFLDRHMMGEYGGGLPSKFTKLDLQKLTDIHLYSHKDDELEPNGDITRVYIFSAIALFILLIACINYMNLSTARSALRAKEIGIRKVVGARKKELIGQFLSESILICYVSLLGAMAITYFTLPALNRLSGQELSFSLLLQWKVLIPLLLIPFLVGLVSGLYPALFMSSFQPIKTLKGLFKVRGANISFRQALVVTQFAIGIILIITTIIVFQQLHYIQNKSLGYDKSQVITMRYSEQIDSRYPAFREEVLRTAGFKEMARSSRIPTGRLLDNMGASTESGDSLRPVNTDIKYVFVDYDFANTFALSMASGRFFSRDFRTDSAGFIINETTAKALGWNASNSVGKVFAYGGTRGHIIGVMKDFHFESMHQAIVPMVLLLPPPADPSFNNLSLKVAGTDIRKSVASLEKICKTYFPENAFEYNFLDDRFANLYQAEQRQATLFTVFACVAIAIACLGLFGLSAFAISQRVKEIGVRKVLGADVGSIVALLSRDFLKLVAVAAVLAFPVAWLAMNSWLKDFAYRVNIAWWVFLCAGLCAAIIAFATVSVQAIRAALANPVKSLRTE